MQILTLSLNMFEINYKIVNNPNEQVQMKNYISCIKINGVPILSPMMTPEKRTEMLHYKNLAVKIEESLQSKLFAKPIDKYTNFKIGNNFFEKSLKHEQVPFSDEGMNENADSQFVFENISSHNSGSPRSPIELTDLLPDNSFPLVPSKSKSEFIHMNAENQVPSLENNINNNNLFIKEQIENQCTSHQNLILHDNFPDETNSSHSVEYNEETSFNEIFSEILISAPSVNNKEKVKSPDVSIISSKEDDIQISVETENVQNLEQEVINKNTDDKTIGQDTDTDSTQRIISTRSSIPLIRQNSYTLDSPSPILLAMIESQLKTEGSVRSPEKTQYSNKEQRKRSCWDLEKAKEKWSSMESISVYIPNNNSKIANKKLSKDKIDSNCLLPISKKIEVSKSAESIPQVIKDKKVKKNKLTSLTSKNKNVLKPTSITKHSVFPKNKDAKEKPKTFSKSSDLTLKSTASTLLPHENSNQDYKSSLKDLQILKTQNFIDEKKSIIDKTEEHFQNNSKILKLKSSILDQNISLKSSNNCENSNLSNNIVSKESIQKLFVKIQNQHSNQMAELVERQKKEQEKLMKIFNEQHFFLMTQIHTNFPDMFDVLKKNQLNETNNSIVVKTQSMASNVVNTINTNGNISNELLADSNSNEGNGNRYSCDNFKYHCPYNSYDINYIDSSGLSNDISNQLYQDMNLLPTLNQTLTSHSFENDTHRSTNRDSLSSTDHAISKDSLNEDIEANSVTITQELSSKRNSVKEHVFLNLNKIKSNQFEFFSTEEINKVNDEKLFSAQFYRKKYNIQEIKATVILQAATRGFFVRRLMRTERVQTLIKTVKDTLLCALELHHEDLGEIKAADVELHRRLIQQLTSACYSLHDLFFSTSIQEKTSIISSDRKRLQNQLSRSSSARSTPSLSTTTRKVIQRKRQQNLHGTTNVTPTNYKDKQSIISDLQKSTQQKLVNSWLGSSHHSPVPNTSNNHINKKPWR